MMIKTALPSRIRTLALVVSPLAASPLASRLQVPMFRLTVHILRHTMALDLLQAGVDRSVIALWLGHESVETTQIYLEATLAIKEKALERAQPLARKFARYHPGDQLLGFLNSL